MKICPKSVFELFPASNGVFREDFNPVPSWPFELEGYVLDGVEIISSSHMDMEDIVLNPDPRVCCSVVCLYVYGFESLWKFMVQHLVGET